jgi:hypothetical protein
VTTADQKGIRADHKKTAGPDRIRLLTFYGFEMSHLADYDSDKRQETPGAGDSQDNEKLHQASPELLFLPEEIRLNLRAESGRGGKRNDFIAAPPADFQVGAETFLDQPGQFLVFNLLGVPEHSPVKIDMVSHGYSSLQLLYWLTASAAISVVNRAAIFSEM